MQSRHCRRNLSIPTMKTSRRAALSEDERLDTLGRLLTDMEISMRLYVAGVTVLLYAQPLTRIVRLTVDDVIHDGYTVLLRLGEPASPVPAPVAALLLEHIANRDNMNTATNQHPAGSSLVTGRANRSPRSPVRTLGRGRRPGRRPRRRHPTATPRTARPRRRGRTRSPRQDPRPPPQRDRRDMEPIRPRKPRSIVSKLNPWGTHIG